jgi:acyl-CoA thioester hydrolase
MINPVSTWRTRVRLYECDALGHVNNAVYLHYMQQATAEAWPSLGAPAWELRTLAIEYMAPAHSGEMLEVEAVAGGFEADRLICYYNITRMADMRVILHARAAWLPPAQEKGLPPAIGWPSAPRELPGVTPLRLPSDRLQAHRYDWRHTVCSYEMDGSGRANPVQLLRWVEEAKFVACSEVGWPLSRMFDADLMIVQLRHDSRFHAPLRAGERIQVVSWISDLRLFKGTWSHEIYRTPPGETDAARNELVALDYSTGAFLTRAGRPNPAPKAMMDALLRGTAAE